MGRFADVAGQFVHVGRPAEGYVTMVDHAGHAMVASREALCDQPAIVLAQLADYDRVPILGRADDHR
jgi:hypothetical protein